MYAGGELRVLVDLPASLAMDAERELRAPVDPPSTVAMDAGNATNTGESVDERGVETGQAVKVGEEMAIWRDWG